MLEKRFLRMPFMFYSLSFCDNTSIIRSNWGLDLTYKEIRPTLNLKQVGGGGRIAFDEILSTIVKPSRERIANIEPKYAYQNNNFSNLL